ncbi:hypothetical protein [Actinoplanes flavus]|uniref:Uncharacterized protein n=1 Tax=Actinoplanes flavus TaxID=2820290 RepID=A0ABS3UCU8_9ACTN|nr:hypothetical protein [Actinoplanes flavus]MBO3736595.1 hypothetical protein [Actinoplanes flavus]
MSRSGTALVIALVSTIVGMAGSLLAYAVDKSIPGAILYGFGAFTASCFLLLGFAHYMGGKGS